MSVHVIGGETIGVKKWSIEVSIYEHIKSIFESRKFQLVTDSSITMLMFCIKKT